MCGFGGCNPLGKFCLKPTKSADGEEHNHGRRQWDEVAMGTRKYHRGRRVRQSGVQWAVTGAHVDFENGKTLEIDCQFIPNRTAAALRPHVEARLACVQGALASTDAFRAYPAIMHHWE